LDALRVGRTHPIWGGAFHNGQSCALCHSNDPDLRAMRAPDGADAAPYNQWRATMMANASRDPLWRAVVSAEMQDTPSRAAEIQAKCMRCHAPMAHTNAQLFGSAAPTLGLLKQNSIEAQLALDGVSCALCHQIQPDNLGQPDSYSGHYKIGRDRVIFGPYPEPYADPMKHNADYTVTQGLHIQRAALCGSCHTLLTDALTPEGAPTGDVFPEQTPYLEWRNSHFNDETSPAGPLAQSCQSCHMPTLKNPDATSEKPDWATRVARSPHGEEFGPAPERAPYAQHLFVGGNTLVPAIFRDNMDVFKPHATRSAFNALIALARQQLQTRTVKMTLTQAHISEGMLSVDVHLKNLTGHRFPTGHPSRRAWLRLTVRDAAGRVVFVSGEADSRGRILGPDAKPLANEQAGGGFYPHLGVIERPDQAHVLDLVMGDASGRITYSLIRAAKPLRDNRLLPLGWRADHPDAALTKPHGTDADPDFLAGEDTVAYRVALPQGLQGPFKIEAALLYQTLGTRYAAELLTHDTPEVNAFRALYEALSDGDVAPVVVAQTEILVQVK
jgi:mono/diheme cytochrome c family protein